jgi:dephospho-CoA kinase
MSYIVALTGGIGSGKTTVANQFASLGAAIVDADVIARQVVEPGMPALVEIVERFGDDILNNDGSLNRRALREIIFQQPQQKNWLNQLIHPLIQQQTLNLFNTINAPYIIWVIPLLIENGLTHFADRILVIDVSRETQIERTMLRDGSDRQLAENILSAQVSRETRLSYADDIINNDGSLALIAQRVNDLHQQYLLFAQQKSAIVIK